MVDATCVGQRAAAGTDNVNAIRPLSHSFDAKRRLQPDAETGERSL